MRKLTVNLMFVFAAVAAFAQERMPAPESPLPPPVIRPVNLRADEKPTTIATYAVEARVAGAFATVRALIVVENPNSRPLEGRSRARWSSRCRTARACAGTRSTSTA